MGGLRNIDAKKVGKNLALAKKKKKVGFLCKEMPLNPDADMAWELHGPIHHKGSGKTILTKKQIQL